MPLKSILNRVQRHQSFVYGTIRLAKKGTRLILEIRIRARKGSKPKPHVETFHEKQAKEIKCKQLMVMLMRVNGTPFSAITKELGCTQTTARVYFSKFARSLAREAEKRKVPVSDVLTERSIPLAAIELMKKDGIRIPM